MKFVVGPVVWQVLPPPQSEVVCAQHADRNVIPAGASNVLVERAVFETVGGFDEELAHLADWDLWLRLLEAGPPAAASGIGLAYRLHPGAMSLNSAGIPERRRRQPISLLPPEVRGDKNLSAFGADTRCTLSEACNLLIHDGRAIHDQQRPADGRTADSDVAPRSPHDDGRGSPRLARTREQRGERERTLHLGDNPRGIECRPRTWRRAHAATDRPQTVGNPTLRIRLENQ